MILICLILLLIVFYYYNSKNNVSESSKLIVNVSTDNTPHPSDYNTLKYKDYNHYNDLIFGKK